MRRNKLMSVFLLFISLSSVLSLFYSFCLAIMLTFVQHRDKSGFSVSAHSPPPAHQQTSPITPVLRILELIFVNKNYKILVSNRIESLMSLFLLESGIYWCRMFDPLRRTLTDIYISLLQGDVSFPPGQMRTHPRDYQIFMYQQQMAARAQQESIPNMRVPHLPR